MDKKRFTFIVIGITACLLMGCGKVNTETKKITAEQAYEKMQGEECVTVVDVRTAEEYAQGHIPGAILIPNEEIGSMKPDLLPVLDAEILVYCRSGNRSAQAVSKLAELGYTNVIDFGGINEWNYDTEKSEWENKSQDFSSFRAVDLNGKVVDESLFEQADLTMINIWATYCGPCLREMPELGELSIEYADQNVQIIGVVIDTLSSDGQISQDFIEKSRDLANQTGAAYEHLLPTTDLLKAGLASIYSVPTTFFVDSQGELVGEPYVGARDKAAWQEIIGQLKEE